MDETGSGPDAALALQRADAAERAQHAAEVAFWQQHYTEQEAAVPDIAVIFEGCGRRTEKRFATIAETADHLVVAGYTRVSGLPHYTPSIATRIYKDTRSGQYARINTCSSPRSWPVVVVEVMERTGAIR